jgi:isopropylmalate/homocitrate/citramalate synthase
MRLYLSAICKINPYIKTFDITMRDGLQSIPKVYTFNEKKKILHKIMKTYNPESLEIGSIISPRLLPQMKHSYKLYNYANNLYNDNPQNIYNKCDFYLLVPPTKQYLNIAKTLNIKNISLITSVSNQYQIKNNNQSIKETKNIIKDTLKIPNTFNNVKLYVSCITNCPIKGKQDNDYIVNELYDYLHIDGISEVCISDTCGNMRYSDFKHIIDYLNIEMNYKLDKVSIDLHVNHNDEKKYYLIDNIIEYAINNNIYKFNVSSFENIYFGNSHITIDVRKFNNNLTYDRLYEGINNYQNYL